MKQVIELMVTRNGKTTKHAALLENTPDGPALDSPIDLEAGDILEFRALKDEQTVDIQFTVR